MPQSMTGFGRSEVDGGGLSATVEIRSVNNRFLNVKVKLPPRYLRFEQRVEEEVRRAVSRGTVDVFVRVNAAARAVAPHVDGRLAQAYGESIARLKASLKLEGDLDLRTMLSLPGVVALEEPGDVAEADGEALIGAVRKALKELVRMRAAEGARLHDELVRIADRIAGHAAAIAKRLPRVIPEYRRKLFRRIEALVDERKLALDPGALEREVALVADRCDVSEELARLDSHLAEFRKKLGAREPIGRSLDFVVQEMGREANTIGSKNQDAAIGSKVIALKSEIERLREQVQNLE